MNLPVKLAYVLPSMCGLMMVYISTCVLIAAVEKYFSIISACMVSLSKSPYFYFANNFCNPIFITLLLSDGRAVCHVVVVFIATGSNVLCQYVLKDVDAD